MKCTIDGVTYNVPEKEIIRMKTVMKIPAIECARIWLEDEGKLHNEEQENLCKKAKESGVTRTIHVAKDVKKFEQKTQRERVKKFNATKADIIKTLAEAIGTMNADNINIEKPEKLITFTIDGKNFKLDLIQSRDKK